MPGTLQTPNLVKDVYGKLLFTKGDNKLYDTNTSSNSDREITTLAGVTNITPDLTLAGDLTVTGGKITFGNGEIFNNEIDNTLELLSRKVKLGGTGYLTQIWIDTGIGVDSRINFSQNDSSIWVTGCDGATLDYVIDTGTSLVPTDACLSINYSSSAVYMKGRLTVNGDYLYGSAGLIMSFNGTDDVEFEGSLTIEGGDITFPTSSDITLPHNSPVAQRWQTGTGGVFHTMSTSTGNYNILSVLDRNDANATKAGRRFKGTHVMSANVGTGCVAGISFEPTYDGDGSARKIFNHNYIQCFTPTLLNSANCIDASVIEFDEDEGVHKAVDAGTTKTSPGTVQAWMKININGDIHYIPAYLDKTN